MRKRGRPKNSFRYRRGYRPPITGEFVPAGTDDDDLPPDLADIVQLWRCVYSENLPRAMDVRKTLLALSLDDDPIRALQSLDTISESLLMEALHKQGNAEKGLSPDDRVRDAAQNARLRFALTKGGRPSQIETDRAFARVLIIYWLKTKRTKPTVTVHVSDISDESEFLSWAWQMFSRAGRQISSSTLAPILRRAKRYMRESRVI